MILPAKEIASVRSESIPQYCLKFRQVSFRRIDG